MQEARKEEQAKSKTLHSFVVCRTNATIMKGKSCPPLCPLDDECVGPLDDDKGSLISNRERKRTSLGNNFGLNSDSDSYSD